MLAKGIIKKHTGNIEISGVQNIYVLWISWVTHLWWCVVTSSILLKTRSDWRDVEILYHQLYPRARLECKQGRVAW